jgi:PleD family two-component response regulator
MVTASMEPGVQHKAMQAGATGFVSKPFRIYELTRHIRAALTLHTSPSEPPTSQRRATRRKAAAHLLGVAGAVDLRLRLRREAEHDGQDRACMVIRIGNERQISQNEGRHAIDAVLGAIGQSLIGTLGEDAVYWSDAAELASVMDSGRLQEAVEAARRAVLQLEPLKVHPVELRMGAVRYRAAAALDIDAVLQQARMAAEAAPSSGGPIVIRSLGEQAPVSSA